jgi:shikimate dehydrogenase
MFAEQTGQNISYEKIEAPLDGFAATIQRLRDEGYKGCSVTVPFKFEAYKLATQLTARAKAAQAVNTLKFDGDIILGDNTDGAGLVRDIQSNLNIIIKGKNVLLLGAGGAAWGVATPLLEQECYITIANRSEEKTKLLILQLRQTSSLTLNIGSQLQEFDTRDGNLRAQTKSYASLREDPRQYNLVINATSAGLTDSELPLSSTIFAPNVLAYDMMYGRETPFMKFSREHGAQVADGLGMLVEQAAEAFYLWRGVRPDTAPVIAKLRAIL